MDYKNLLPQHDELIRCYNVLVDNINVEEAFCKSLSWQQQCILEYQNTVEECKRLKVKLDLANKDMSVVVNKLSAARRWLDAERQYRKRVEAEREALAHHLDEVRRILLADPRHKLSDEAKEKLSFLNRVSSESSLNNWRPHGHDRLITIAESDSMSDMSFSRSGDDLDDFPMPQVGQKHRTSYIEDECNITKKRKSSIDAHFTSPPAAAASIQPDLIKTPMLEELKANIKNIGNDVLKLSAIERINMRNHNFVTKTFIMPESCSWCSRKIGFGRSVFKCLDCQTVAHTECCEKVPLPCIPMGTSPKKTGAGFISDYTPSVPPMIPAVVVHCAIEVERRGLTEIGIYRMSGTEAVVRGLREKFLKGKGVPCLTDVDIHSVCCFLKDFLRNLQDPLIPQNKWTIFAGAINENNKEEKLKDIVLTLPQANRDTLAYLILHLKNVANSPECKMTTSNLATVFGPTVVGYSNNEPMAALTDAHTANAIMEELMLLLAEYWNNIISGKLTSIESKTTVFTSVQTPDIGPLSHRTPRRLMTPGSKRKYFKTSPPI